MVLNKHEAVELLASIGVANDELNDKILKKEDNQLVSILKTKKEFSYRVYNNIYDIKNDEKLIITFV